MGPSRRTAHFGLASAGLLTALCLGVLGKGSLGQWGPGRPLMVSAEPAASADEVAYGAEGSGAAEFEAARLAGGVGRGEGHYVEDARLDAESAGEDPFVVSSFTRGAPAALNLPK